MVEELIPFLSAPSTTGGQGGGQIFCGPKIFLSKIFCSNFLLLFFDLVIAKLSQAPAPAGLSLALFPNYPATRPVHRLRNRTNS